MDKATQTLITYSYETLRSKGMRAALSQLLENYFFNSIASIKLLEQVILGLIQVRNVNLTELSLSLLAELPHLLL